MGTSLLGYELTRVRVDQLPEPPLNPPLFHSRTVFGNNFLELCTIYFVEKYMIVKLI